MKPILSPSEGMDQMFFNPRLRTSWAASILTLVALGAIALLLRGPDVARAQVSGPPVIVDVLQISVSAPVTGSTVKVTVPPTSLDNVDPAVTSVRIADVSTGEWTPFQQFQNKVMGFSIVGSMGDLIQIEVVNSGMGQDNADIGYVPAPSDTAPPDFRLDGIDHTYSGGVLTVSFDAGAILDNSWPVIVDLTISTDTVSTSVAGSASGTMSNGAFTLDLAAAPGDLAVLVASDDFGNRSEVNFIVNQHPPATTVSFPAPSPGQTDAERTGMAAHVPVADGQSYVTVQAREFLHSQAVFTVPGPILTMGLRLHYRSGLAYTGPFGASWDSNIDDRLEFVDNDTVYWHRGDGRREGPFVFTHDSYPTLPLVRYFDSPKGIFLRLVEDTGNLQVYLEDINEGRHVFDRQTGLLASIEDYYGTNSVPDNLNQIHLVRNANKQVVRIAQNTGQVASLGWFHDGRLASIRLADRTVRLIYDGTGNLSRVTLANGSAYEYEYATGTAYLTRIKEVSEASNPPTITIAENDYESGSFSVAAHHSRHNPSAAGAAPTAFQAIPSGLLVTDPTGAETVVTLDSLPPYAVSYIEERSNLDTRDQASNPDFPSSVDDPYGWRTLFSIHPENYLLLSVARETSQYTEAYLAGPLSERQSWDYVSPTHQDPRLRARLRHHNLLDPAGQVEFSSEWTFSGPGDPAPRPDTYRSFNEVLTVLSYNAGGQITEQRISGVNNASQTATYEIVETHVYDSLGRIIEYYGPNRNSVAPDKPSNMMAYHTDGIQLGYLKRSTSMSRDSTPIPGPWSEYEYDAFGNVVLQRVPGQAGDVVTMYQFDALDRLLSYRGPDATLVSNGNVVWDERTYSYSADGFRLHRISRKFFDHLGVPGTGTPEQPISVTLLDREFDSYGRTIAESRDFDVVGGSPRQSKTAYTYDLLGRVATRHDLVDAPLGAPETWTETDYEYDARGLLLRRIRAADAPIALSTWYRYDQSARECERYDPHTRGHAFRTDYDTHGRILREVGPDAAQSHTGASAPRGASEVRYSYSDEGTPKYDLQCQEVYYHDGGYPQLPLPIGPIRSTRYVYDEAGRTIVTKRLYAQDKYTHEPTDLFPDGTIQREYNATDADTTTEHYYNYVLKQLDSFDRPHITERWDSLDGIEYRRLERTRRTFDAYTGWLSTVEQTLLNEAPEGIPTPPPAEVTYTTTVEYDESGRPVSLHELGSLGAATPIRTYKIVYDGLGRLRERYYVNGDETEAGSRTRLHYNFAGEVTEELYGLAFGPTDLYERITTTLDLKGRPATTAHWNGSISRQTHYSYDSADRLTTVLHPHVGGTVPTRTLTYGFDTDGFEFREIQGENDVLRRETYNEVGLLLKDEVVDWAAVTPNGAQSVLYTYNGNSQCTCPASGRATRIETTPVSSGLFSTIVERDYTPAGRLARETLEVVNAGISHAMTTSFTNDAQSNIVQIDYPDLPGGEPGSSLRTEYRSDGAVRRMLRLVEGEYRIEGEYAYEGFTQTLSTIYDEYNSMSSPTQNVVLVTFDSLDELGRLRKRRYVDHTNGAIQYTDEVLSRNIDGLVTHRLQPPRSLADPTNQLHSFYDYGGPGWLVRQHWNSTGVPTIGDEELYGRNRFGEIDSVDVTKHYPNCDQEFPAVYQSWTIDRNSGGYQTGITVDQSPVPGLVAKAFNYDAPDMDYITAGRSGHTYTTDLAGRSESRLELDHARPNCDSCASSGVGSVVRDTHIIDRSFDHDAWGRVTQRELLTSIDPSSHTYDCLTQSTSSGGAAWPSRTQQYVYDGLGRLVYSEHPDDRYDSTVIGYYHAYAGRARIASQQQAGARYSEHFRNQHDGISAKFRRGGDPSSGWGSVAGGPINGTNQTDIFGNVVNGNANDESAGLNNEGQFASPLLFLMSGGLVQQCDIAYSSSHERIFADGLGISCESPGTTDEPDCGRKRPKNISVNWTHPPEYDRFKGERSWKGKKSMTPVPPEALPEVEIDGEKRRAAAQIRMSLKMTLTFEMEYFTDAEAHPERPCCAKPKRVSKGKLTALHYPELSKVRGEIRLKSNGKPKRDSNGNVVLEAKVGKDIWNHEKGHFELMKAFAKRFTKELNNNLSKIDAKLENWIPQCVSVKEKYKGAAEKVREAIGLESTFEELARQFYDRASYYGQDPYEHFTKNGTDPAQQKQWDKKIRRAATEPSSLSEFRETMERGQQAPPESMTVGGS